MKQQVNVTLCEKTAKRVKIDAIQMGVTLQDWATIAFTKFLDLPVAQRRAASCTARKKLLGRPISTK